MTSTIKKGRTYRENWGDAELKIADVRTLATTDIPGPRESGLGIIPLPGPFACGRWRRIEGRSFGCVLAFLEVG